MQTIAMNAKSDGERKRIRPETKAFILTLGLAMIAATLLSLIAAQLALHFRWQL